MHPVVFLVKKKKKLLNAKAEGVGVWAFLAKILFPDAI